MYKLVSDRGRWAVKDHQTGKFMYIFSNVVWVSDAKEALKYTLIEENSYDKIELDKPIEEYLVECSIFKDKVGTVNYPFLKGGACNASDRQV